MCGEAPMRKRPVQDLFRPNLGTQVTTLPLPKKVGLKVDKSGSRGGGR